MASSFVIAAPHSGSGKTTITLGLLRALHNKGKKVQPFKVGPDYLDTTHHTIAAHHTSYNLDLFMSTEEHVKSTYQTHQSTSDVAITEGVMGLFDGAKKMQGSTAAVAELLDQPIVLVMSGKAMAYSAAPLLYGLKNFYKNIKVVGVIFNFVKTESHYQFLKEAAIDAGVTPLGYIPPNEEIQISSRHLGLSIDQKTDFDTLANSAAEHISKHLDLEKLLEITQCSTPSQIHSPQPKNEKKEQVIAVAKDEAFNFIYPANIAQLSENYQVVYFSPIHDKKLPKADAIYIAGGYPELFLDSLSQNIEMKQEIRHFIEQEGKVFAECGGMMYLGEEIITKEGKHYQMCGIFPYSTTMQKMKLHLGYRDITYNKTKIRGHEFHYSQCIEHNQITKVGEVYNARGGKVDTPIYQYKNCHATYIHLYWAHLKDLWVL
ncbi:cobyrinate a,c-diamide synthase [Halosquirtibacter laminarini]|uniref:Cobyrinate a,c-diamide synthase n=1 Tax=Halosquirtibacter laminarini TaxID=3374600 RepID=A0AC61NQ54_9BACT|nr:cobyrinate a,c-diamide synthase [Prolixibacteraceae bacterium]